MITKLEMILILKAIVECFERGSTLPIRRLITQFENDLIKEQKVKDSITPELIRELLEASGFGIIECKKALVANDANIGKAIKWLRYGRN